MNDEAKEIIAKLGLEPLPDEGGYFRRTWTGPARSQHDPRPTGTAIYFLITPESFSALHQVDADEVWHFQAGDPVELLQLATGSGEVRKYTLGSDLLIGHTPQLVVKRGVWQGARLAEVKRGWALIGCTMTPGWDEQGFVLGNRNSLIADFPTAANEIRRLTR